MSISARIGLVSIVCWISGWFFMAANDPWSTILLIAAAISTVVAVFYPDLPNSKYNLKRKDVSDALRAAVKESFVDEAPTENDPYDPPCTAKKD